MEFKVTISPDPKKRIQKKEYGAMAPRKQYQTLVHNISSLCAKIRLISKYYFIFEISNNGNIHTHGTIHVQDTSNNTHMLAIKTFQQNITEILGRSANKQYYMDVCCKIKPRDDTIVSDKYSSWEDYLAKEQQGLPTWMKPIDSDNIKTVREMIDFHEEERRAFMSQFKTSELDAGILVDFE